MDEDEPTTTRGRVRTALGSLPVQVGLLVGAIGWMLDQATKAAAVQSLSGRAPLELPGPLFLQLTYNQGAAFGLPAPWWLFLVVTVVVVALVIWHLPAAEDPLEPVAYGLLAAGALGNLTDRLVRPHPDGFGQGEVVDFIASRVWPTFNVADMCITVGFGLLLVAAYRVEHHAGAPVTGRDRQPAAALARAASHTDPTASDTDQAAAHAESSAERGDEHVASGEPSAAGAGPDGRTSTSSAGGYAGR